MKRMFSFALALVFAFSMLAGCSQEPGKVLFIGKEKDDDAIIIKHLQKMGLVVTVGVDELVKSEDAAAYDLIVISNNAKHGSIGGAFKQSQTPIVHLKAGMTYAQGLIAKAEDSGNLNYETKVNIQTDHPLAAGFNGEVNVYKVGGNMGYAIPGEEAVVIATAGTDDSKPTIFAYEKGAKDASPLGGTVTARQVFFYLIAGEVVNQTKDGWKLFDASIKWAMDN